MADPMRKHKVVLTYEDYLSLPNDRNRHEILEGELIMTPSPSTKHQEISRNLTFILFSHTKTHGLGKVFNAPVDVLLDRFTIVVPDIVFISKDRLNIITPRAIEGAPDLLVEILSPCTAKYDRISKMQLFSRFGVPWYWIVDPEGCTLEEYERDEDAYRLKAAYSNKFEPALFPGLTVDLSEVWEL